MRDRLPILALAVLAALLTAGSPLRLSVCIAVEGDASTAEVATDACCAPAAPAPDDDGPRCGCCVEVLVGVAVALDAPVDPDERASTPGRAPAAAPSGPVAPASLRVVSLADPPRALGPPAASRPLLL